MKIIKHLKAGATVAPALLILVYFIFVGLDIFTTYLGSPDLKFEGNWVVKNFGLNWIQIIIFGTSHALLAAILFLLSINYTHIFFRKSIDPNRRRFVSLLIHNRLLFLSLFAVGYFYNNLFYSVFITFNNYLSHLYINNIENMFSNISDSYVNLEIMVGKFFFPITYILSISAATIYTIYMTRKIEKKYLKVSGSKDSL